MTKQVIKTIVVDDEPLARKGLRARLERHDDVQVLAECQNGLEAVSSISQHRPDLVFLDIQMPQMLKQLAFMELLTRKVELLLDIQFAKNTKCHR